MHSRSRRFVAGLVSIQLALVAAVSTPAAAQETEANSVPVHVETTTELSAPPDPATAASVKNVDGNALLSWEADTQPTGGWVIRVDGEKLDVAAPEAREITITDVPLNNDLKFSVAPMVPPKPRTSPMRPQKILAISPNSQRFPPRAALVSDS